MNKTVLGVLGALGGIIVIGMMWFISTGNHMVGLEENWNEKKSQVENVYQRRFDLIPNLVNTVKGYAKHEADVLTAVTEARAKVGQVKITGNENMAEFQKSQDQLSSALSRLMVVAEKYPDLKANQNFLELQSQLEGTENRITIERQRFNEAAREFNTAIKRFPGSLVASTKGYHEKPYFTAQAEAQKAPEVKF